MNHEIYESYAALHASGQLTPNEQEAFEEHVRECSSCRKMANDFATISSVMFAAKGCRHAKVNEARLERFFERGVREGVFISGRPVGMRLSFLAVPACIVLLLLSFAYVHTRRSSPDADQRALAIQRNDIAPPSTASFASESRRVHTLVRIVKRRHKAPAQVQNDTFLSKEPPPETEAALPQNFARFAAFSLPLTGSDRASIADPTSLPFRLPHISVSDHFFDPPYKTVGAAALEYPDNMRMMQQHDFAADMRQFRFRLPLAQIP